MGLLPETQNPVLRMRRGCRELFSRHQRQKKPLVSDPGMHHGTSVTHVPWCMSGSLNRSGGENVPGIPGACATRDFSYLVGAPLHTSTGNLISGQCGPRFCDSLYRQLVRQILSLVGSWECGYNFKRNVQYNLSCREYWMVNYRRHGRHTFLKWQTQVGRWPWVVAVIIVSRVRKWANAIEQLITLLPAMAWFHSIPVP